MIARYRAILILFGLAVLSGCASTKVTQETSMAGQELARPNQIWVYDFIAAPAKVPVDSYISADLSAPTTPPTAEELETGRKVGALISKELVAISGRWVFPQCKPVREQRHKLATASFAVTWFVQGGSGVTRL